VAAKPSTATRIAMVDFMLFSFERRPQAGAVYLLASTVDGVAAGANA
jgi:hypothetical protein